MGEAITNQNTHKGYNSRGPSNNNVISEQPHIYYLSNQQRHTCPTRTVGWEGVASEHWQEEILGGLKSINYRKQNPPINGNSDSKYNSKFSKLKKDPLNFQKVKN